MVHLHLIALGGFELSRRQPGELAEVAYEVSLIEVSAHQRKACPIGRGCRFRRMEGALEAANTCEELRCHSHLAREDLDETPVTHTEAVTDVGYAHVRPFQLGDSCRNNAMTFASPTESPQKGLPQGQETPLEARVTREPLAELTPRRSPQNIQLDMAARDLAR